MRPIAVPALTLLAVAWFALRAPPWTPGWTYAFLPFWLGLAAAPGYARAWWALDHQVPLAGRERAWCLASIWLGALAALAGSVLSLFMLLLAPFAFWSFLEAVSLGVRVLRAQP